jgi:phosphate transport system substrate-binding protein
VTRFPSSVLRLPSFVFRLSSFVLLLASCTTPPPPPTPTTLRIETTDLTTPLLLDLAAAYAEVNPDIDLVSDVVPLSTLSADLAAGRADVGLAVTQNPDQFATPLGYVSFAVVVNPANPLTGLSVAQVREIFSGRVNDWDQVGGPSGGIQVVSREKGSDAEMTFETSALLGASPTSNALVAPTWAAMREAVSQNLNTIGYLPVPELEATVQPIGLDSEVRALIVALAPSEPIGPARDFLVWAQSEAGQEVVGKRYEAVTRDP